LDDQAGVPGEASRGWLRRRRLTSANSWSRWGCSSPPPAPKSARERGHDTEGLRTYHAATALGIWSRSRPEIREGNVPTSIWNE